MFRICVCGGRDYSNFQKVSSILSSAKEVFPNLEIIHGCARGADSLASSWCKKDFTIIETKFPADWDQFGKSAGPIRNQQMLKYGFDLLIAFPGGTGTAHMISITEKAKIPVRKIKD